ncbi:olfactory receptor 7G1-like [Dipodomys spectabilis]|uniref:olfactory receptor 7G1-like n=1 Tax=Dipodomys spectabilis TaxID=105255 RepID=UPI001C54507C|nr:olfactory receptor 7G1-like [Dipodomys spectabilis]
MQPTNQTAIARFFLVGLTDDPEFQPLIFSLFMSIYLITILGNLLIILAVSSDTHLHTPMYIFLTNLSLTDICTSTTTIPKVLMNIQAQDHSISFAGCLAQVCFILIFGGLESCLLTAMAYDRYVAICHPLRYAAIMHPHLCVLIVIMSLLIITTNALLHSLILLRLSFCTDLKIPHFFCELVQVMNMACSDTSINSILVYVATSVFAGIPLSGIILSYAQIVSSILRIPTMKGRYKAFSTCGSHLSVVSLFYGTAFGLYMSSKVADSATKNVVASMMYVVVPQMLNPFIYSLRNREIKEALRHLLFGKLSALTVSAFGFQE